MKCMVCGQEVSGRSKCPNCGFPVYYTPGQENEEIKKKVEKLAEKYRRKKLDQFDISLYSCSYEMKEEHLKVKNEEWIPLITGMEMKPGTEKWLDRLFARQRLDKPVKLKLKMRWFGKEKEEEVEIKPPVIFDFWRVGVRMSDEGHVQILLGRQDCFECSGALSIFGDV
ncbi:MAG: hypothetical protein SO016_03535 [Lachnospiraceae bacterium]|nr:hypothetical protein [Robinsoniella sp.]MDY3765758.1 hypothetical protein [Lachnospiraceae bacterium]